MKYKPTRTSHSTPRETAAAFTVDRTARAGGSREISAGEFKARCLALMEDVREHGGEYVITKRGRPVAKLVPVSVERRPLLGSMKGTVTVFGDIVNPLDEPWDALDGGNEEPR